MSSRADIQYIAYPPSSILQFTVQFYNSFIIIQDSSKSWMSVKFSFETVMMKAKEELRMWVFIVDSFTA